MNTDDGAKPRRDWERRWREGGWQLSARPAELVQLLAETRLPAGAALDLGCGAGGVTTFLSETFRPAVGIDFSLAAIQEARRSRRIGGTVFAVADGARPPFRSGTFALIFDRGCLKAISRDRWVGYFTEVHRLLVPGGVLQLYLPKEPPVLSRRGIKVRVRRLLRDGVGAVRSRASSIRRMPPPGMRITILEAVDMRLPTDRVVIMIHAILRKEEADARKH